MHCEVCHKPFNPQEMAELADKFKEQIYRPGDDVRHLGEQTDEEAIQRRREIEEIFADPEAYNREQMSRYEEADRQAAEGTLTIEQ